MSDLPEGYEWCTSESRRKRHASNNLKPDRHAPRKKGRGGSTACGSAAQDEERANWFLSLWTTRPRRLEVMALPVCGSCARSIAKRVAR